ncbi:MAG: acetylornithine deacetylase/succinyl-diaminopimelate desuccinylase-like protein [Pirellulaceae bacterium]|jgi:acetylornithine deacetylase/succinyl-diaminopimelate desuccinylase-like protein
MPSLDEYLEANAGQFQEDLFELLRIPSVSTDSQYKEDVLRAGQWVADQFTAMNLSPELIETDGHPIIYAETPHVPGAPTVLVYGHYDVQPPDPLDEWISPPFEPTVRDGSVYARGATDDKGQMLTHIKSAQTWMAVEGKLPLQLKFIIEGEEEDGSEAIYKYLDENVEKLKADVAVISDSSQFAPGQPAITYGLKGIVYFEIFLKGPKQDLHSGTFGGGVTNPVNTLCKIMSKIIDNDGRIQIPGFYDEVIPLSDRERAQFAALPFSDDDFMNQIGVDGVTGEKDYSILERRWTRPTFDMNGIWGGYQAEGAKTVLPAKAAAKFSFRLVPNQNPDKIAAALSTMLEELLPPGITMKLKKLHGGQGVMVPLDNPYMGAASRAIEAGFGRAPVFIREGGSIPIVTEFHEKLGIDTLLLGWGLNDDNTHSPNEKFSLADFHRGIKASTHLWSELSKVSPGS